MGILFKVPAYCVYTIAGVWGFFISLKIVFANLGFIGGAIAFMLAPFTLTVAPWYEAIAHSNWFPVMLVYGGGLCATVLYVVGSAIDGD